MKLDHPLYRVQVRGILPDVGTFRHSPWGCILSTTVAPRNPDTTAQRLHRWRFAVESDRLAGYATLLRQPRATTIAAALATLAQSGHVTHARALTLATAPATPTPSTPLPLRAITRSLPP